MRNQNDAMKLAKLLVGRIKQINRDYGVGYTRWDKDENELHLVPHYEVNICVCPQAKDDVEDACDAWTREFDIPSLSYMFNNMGKLRIDFVPDPAKEQRTAIWITPKEAKLLVRSLPVTIINTPLFDKLVDLSNEK